MTSGEAVRHFATNAPNLGQIKARLWTRVARILEGSLRSSAAFEMKKVIRRNDSSRRATCSQKLFAIVDLPVPAGPVSQNTEISGEGVQIQARRSFKMSTLVSLRQAEGDAREFQRAAPVGFNRLSITIKKVRKQT